jgi:hypothetical protein
VIAGESSRALEVLEEVLALAPPTFSFLHQENELKGT